MRTLEGEGLNMSKSTMSPPISIVCL
jgi:hypothetical protein